MSSKLPPGPRYPGPLATLKWQRKPIPLVEMARKRYGHIWTLRLVGGVTFVVISDPDLIKDVFTADPAVVHGSNALAIPLVGKESVLVLNEEEHLAMRSVLQPLFHGERVQRYRDTMAQICEQDLAHWPLHEAMPLLPRLQGITLDVIMSVIFGVTEGAAQESLRARILEMLEFAESPFRMTLHLIRFMRGWAPSPRFLRGRAPVDAAIFEMIESTRQDPHLEAREDILAMLVQARREDGSALTDKQLRDQLMTLLVQGHTSTANAIAWSLERVMRHPEIFERLRAEAQTESEDYLDAVLKETLRVRPPLAFPVREVKQPFVLGEYELEPGTIIAVNTYILQRREDLYPEPDRFRPERFIEQPAAPYTWIPFGGGVRGCIGASFALTEIKVVLRTLLQQARLAPVVQRDEGITRRGVVFSPSEGARALLEERVPARTPSKVATG